MDYNAQHGVQPTTIVSAETLQARADVETLLEQLRRVRLEEGRSVQRRGDFGRLRTGLADASHKTATSDWALQSLSHSQLQAILEEAIKTEHFEEAALVRDHLAKL